MSLLDQLAEKHILAAQRQGDLDNLGGLANRCSWMTTATFLLNCAPAIVS